MLFKQRRVGRADRQGRVSGGRREEEWICVWARWIRQAWFIAVVVTSQRLAPSSVRGKGAGTV